MDPRERPQIEEAKEYLRSSGFADVEDSPDQREHFERDLYAMQMTWMGGRRILRVSTVWMSDHPHPGAVRSGLDGRSIAERLKTHNQVNVLDQGTVEEP